MLETIEELKEIETYDIALKSFDKEFEKEEVFNNKVVYNVVRKNNYLYTFEDKGLDFRIYVVGTPNNMNKVSNYHFTIELLRNNNEDTVKRAKEFIKRFVALDKRKIEEVNEFIYIKETKLSELKKERNELVWDMIFPSLSFAFYLGVVSVINVWEFWTVTIAILLLFSLANYILKPSFQKYNFVNEKVKILKTNIQYYDDYKKIDKRTPIEKLNDQLQTNEFTPNSLFELFLKGYLGDVISYKPSLDNDKYEIVAEKGNIKSELFVLGSKLKGNIIWYPKNEENILLTFLFDLKNKELLNKEIFAEGNNLEIVDDFIEKISKEEFQVIKGEKQESKEKKKNNKLLDFVSSVMNKFQNKKTKEDD